MDETYFRPTRYRRIVTVDIETVSTDPNNPKGALDGLSCQIVCIGVLIDDGVRLTELAIAYEDEAKILTEFWASVQPEDLGDVKLLV